MARRRHAIFSRRRWLIGVATIFVVLAAGVAVPHSVSRHNVRADAKPGSLPANRHATFARALAAEYERLIRHESETYGEEFDRDRFAEKLAAIQSGQLPTPSKPSDYGLSDAGAVALGEARTRLLRSTGGRARDAAPLFAARAQVAYDCWLARAGTRLPVRDIADCRDRFVKRLHALENAVLPISTTSAFNRTLAREYLAYAAYKASDQKDYIDARHFARKGMQAARSTDASAVEPEVLSRWNLDAENAMPRFVRWRRQLTDALEAHRDGAKAEIAAKAQARFDCWVERVSERAPAAAVQKCESEFLEMLGQLKGAPRRTRAVALSVLFDDQRQVLSGVQYAQIRRAARIARRSSSSVSVIARGPDSGQGDEAIRLALRRASAVAEALKRQGVRGDRIRTFYMGERDGRTGRSSPVHSQRAEIVIH